MVFFCNWRYVENVFIYYKFFSQFTPTKSITTKRLPRDKRYQSKCELSVKRLISRYPESTGEMMTKRVTQCNKSYNLVHSATFPVRYPLLFKVIVVHDRFVASYQCLSRIPLVSQDRPDQRKYTFPDSRCVYSCVCFFFFCGGGGGGFYHKSHASDTIG